MSPQRLRSIYIGFALMLIREHVPLAPFTTFGIGGPARYFAEATSEAEVIEGVDFAHSRQHPLFILGGGSNLLVADAGFPGLVLKIGITGLSHETAADESVVFTAGAGVDWDSLVARAVDAQCAGVECLSGIPALSVLRRFRISAPMARKFRDDSGDEDPGPSLSADPKLIQRRVRFRLPLEYLQHRAAGLLCNLARVVRVASERRAICPVRRRETVSCTGRGSSYRGGRARGGAGNSPSQGNAHRPRRRKWPQRRLILQEPHRDNLSSKSCRRGCSNSCNCPVTPLLMAFTSCPQGGWSSKLGLPKAMAKDQPAFRDGTRWRLSIAAEQLPPMSSP